MDEDEAFCDAAKVDDEDDVCPKPTVPPAFGKPDEVLEEIGVFFEATVFVEGKADSDDDRGSEETGIVLRGFRGSLDCCNDCCVGCTDVCFDIPTPPFPSLMIKFFWSMFAPFPVPRLFILDAIELEGDGLSVLPEVLLRGRTLAARAVSDVLSTEAPPPPIPLTRLRLLKIPVKTPPSLLAGVSLPLEETIESLDGPPGAPESRLIIAAMSAGLVVATLSVAPSDRSEPLLRLATLPVLVCCFPRNAADEKSFSLSTTERSW